MSGRLPFIRFYLFPPAEAKDWSRSSSRRGNIERTLNWISDKQLELGERIFFKPTNAPYLRIVAQRRKTAPNQHGPSLPLHSFLGAPPDECHNPRLPGRHRLLLRLPPGEGERLRLS